MLNHRVNLDKLLCNLNWGYTILNLFLSYPQGDVWCNKKNPQPRKLRVFCVCGLSPQVVLHVEGLVTPRAFEFEQTQTPVEHIVQEVCRCPTVETVVVTHGYTSYHGTNSWTNLSTPRWLKKTRTIPKPMWAGIFLPFIQPV